MATIKIGDRVIGEDNPAFIIAEIGINHNGSIYRAKKMIDICKEADVDVVKFQMRDLDELYRKGVFENTFAEDLSLQYTLSLLKKFQLSTEDFEELAEYAREKGLIFMCTPWDKESVDNLEGIGVPAYKIASADMTNLDLLDYVISKDKPMIISTGMSTEEEIEKTVQFLKAREANFALLHCNSTYPAPFKDINLRFMTELEKYDVPVGYSGHERGIAISGAAVAMGATIIERHFTLDRTMEGPDHAASLEPSGLNKLVRNIRAIELAMGTNHRWLSQGERLNRENLGKSLVAANNIAKGQEIKKEDIVVKSPGKGLSPQKINELIGVKAHRNIQADDYFQEDDLKPNFKIKKNYNFNNKWGLVVRYHDIDNIIEASNPDLLEFHFSYSDIEHDYKLDQYDSELVVHAPELWGNDLLLNLCAIDEKERKKSVENLQKTIDLTNKLKTHFTNDKPKIVIHVGGFTMDDFIEENERKEYYERLKKSLSEVDSTGVELLPENMPPYPWLFGGQRYHNIFLDPKEIREFCEDTGYRICYDLSHAKLACNDLGISLEDYTRIIKPYISHLHISDAAGLDGEGLQIGDGEVDFEKVLNILSDINYTFVPEIWQGHKFNGKGFWKALKKLESLNI
ncbi:N-acetylneuraminate synthase family protein [Orenia marismortui]|uniref:N-acetylneuraminate synthase n=1 Tax=Orenia marismortui TaxID=46469 RepID=A0A4R8HFJ2_9FIRM|nr:N-acetylneuraminate synthase family protein [Orenia marismortui]TDX58906.1 N-acetylneuraminate synthase [Orenia marismortui]